MCSRKIVPNDGVLFVTENVSGTYLYDLWQLSQTRHAGMSHLSHKYPSEATLQGKQLREAP